MKIVSRILKWTALALIFGTIAFLIVRILMAEYYPDKIKGLHPSEALRSAYEEDSGLTIRRQKLRYSYDNPDFSLFMANHQYYCPAAGELQLALRYNDSMLDELQKDFSLPEKPLPDPALFDFSLKDDNGHRAHLSFVDTDSRFMYQYLKLVFSDVRFGEETNWIRLEIYYKDAVNYAEEPYACILVYEKELVKDDAIYQIREGELD